MDLQEIRAEHIESRDSKIAVLESRYQRLTDQLLNNLINRNNLSPQRLTLPQIAIQVQSLLACSDLRALVDVLAGMGQIDKLDFISKCVETLHRTILNLERPN